MSAERTTASDASRPGYPVPMVTSANTEPDEAQQLITGFSGLSLRDVLTAECLAGTTVLAGADGLDRPVTSVNVMEVPDVTGWVKSGELLVTTGFPLVGHQQPESGSDATASDPGSMLADLVPDLAAQGLAGIGVKLGRYLDALPETVLRLGDDLGFPVLGLPADLSFDDLLREVYTRLNALQAQVLQQIDALRGALTSLVLEGGDLNQVAAEVGRVLSVGVIITSTDGRERAAALDIDLRERLTTAGLFDPTGRVRVERVSQGRMRLGDGEVLVQPVAAGGTNLAKMVCCAPDRALRIEDVFAVERAATVAALLISRQQAVTAVENKYRGDFLRDVFLGRAGNEDYVRAHAAALGWDLSRPSVVLSARIDPTDPAAEPTGREWQERFFTAWLQVTDARDRSIATVDFSSEVVAVLPAPADEEPSAGVPKAVRAMVEDLVTSVAGDRGGGRRPFSVGVSRVARRLTDLPSAHAQAHQARRVGRRIAGDSSTTFFDDLGVHRLLALVPDVAEVRGFTRDVLGPLDQDTEEAADLRTTLQVLLDANLNVAEAARLQYFHYNTMRYRVSKLERILGPFTSDPHLRLNLAVALQARQFRE